MLARETLPSGQIRLSTNRCTFLYTRLRSGVLLVTVAGYDRGELGLAPLEEIKQEIERAGSALVFIDARNVTGANGQVSDAWTAWIRANQTRLEGIHVLVESKVFYVIVAIAKELMRTGDLMQVYTNEEVFRKALLRTVPDFEGFPEAAL